MVCSGVLLAPARGAPGGTSLDPEAVAVACVLAELGWKVDLDRVRCTVATDANYPGGWVNGNQRAMLALLGHVELFGHGDEGGISPLAWYDPANARVVIRKEDPGWYWTREDVLAHELVHACQAQRLAATGGDVPERPPTLEDTWLAALLREGEATVAVPLFAARGAGASAEGLVPEVFDVDWRAGLIDAWPHGAYAAGARFALPVYRESGTAGLAALLATPPASTEQVLHPDTHGADLPSPIPPPALPEELRDREPRRTDCIGEFGILVLLSDLPVEQRADAFRAAVGWDGDRFWLWETAFGEYAGIWRSVWDREEDARQFVAIAGPALLGSIGRSGRVVTWHNATDPALGERMWKALVRESVVEPEPDARAAEATATFEARWTRDVRRSTRLHDGRWELPVHGLAIALPPGSWLAVEDGRVMARLAPSRGSGSIRIGLVSLPPVPAVRLAAMDRMESKRVRVAGRDAGLFEFRDPDSGEGAIHVRFDGARGPVHVWAEIPARADEEQVSVAREALTSIEALEPDPVAPDPER